MFRHLLAALCAVLLFTSPASAAVVSLRIEGADQTIFEGAVDTAPRVLDGGDGSGPHPCRGDDPDNPRPTPTTALADAAAVAGFSWRGNWDPSFNDFFIDAIGPDASQPPTSYWGVLANGSYTAGGCTETIREGDEVLWAYDTFAHPLILQLDGPAEAAPGETVTVTVSDWQEDANGERFAPVAGASVGGQITDANGEARISVGTAGVVRLKAERADAIRSNALSICVGSCPGETVPPAGEPPAPVEGGSAVVRIGKWHDGDRFVAGAAPRILRGSAAAGAEVELSLARDGGVPVRRASAGPGPLWSHRLERPLGRGRWVVTASAAGQGDELRITVVRGRSLRVATEAAEGRLRRELPRLLAAAKRAETLPELERAALALRAARSAAPRRVTGADASAARPLQRVALASARLVRLIAARQRADGSLGGDVRLTALGALAMTGEDALRVRVRVAARWLRDHESADSGTTGAALAVMAAAGASRDSLRAGVTRLRAAQLPDGGFGTGRSRRSNAPATALAVLGLRAAGAHPGRVPTEDGISPLDLLRALQRSSGGFGYGSRSSRTRPWVTGQVLAAMRVP